VRTLFKRVYASQVHTIQPV